MRIFRSIVQSFVVPMLHAGQDFPFGSSISLQLVGDDHVWRVTEPLIGLAEKVLAGLLFASALHQDVQHVAILIDRSS